MRYCSNKGEFLAIVDNEHSAARTIPAGVKYGVGIILVIAFLTIFYRLGTREFYDTIESRRLLVARHMAVCANWFVPHLEGEILVTKPPLFYWLAALCIKIFGTSAEWTVRLPSAIAGTLCLIFLFGIARLFQSDDEKFYSILAPVILATMLLFRHGSRLGEPDMLMTLFSTAAIFFFLRHVRTAALTDGILFFASLALSIFSKGPLGAIIVLLTIIIFSLIYRRPGYIARLPWLWGIGILLIIFIPWMLLTRLAYPDFFHVITTEMFGRVTGTVTAHAKEVKYYFSKFDSFYYPWSIALYLAVIYLIFRIGYFLIAGKKIKLRIQPMLGFSIVWTLCSLLVLSVISSKRYYYGIVATPPVALLVYAALIELSTIRFGIGKKYYKYSTGIIGAVLVLSFFLIPAAETMPWLEGDHFPPLRFLLLLFGGALLGFAFLRIPWSIAAAAGIAATQIVIFLIQATFFLSVINAQSSPAAAAEIAREMVDKKEAACIIEYREINHAVHFYLGFKPSAVGDFDDIKRVMPDLPNNSRVLFITTNNYWQEMPENLKESSTLIYKSPEPFFSSKKRLCLFTRLYTPNNKTP